jgi:putative hydrolase of the HAD superfamily
MNKYPQSVFLDLDDTIIDDSMGEAVWLSICQKYAPIIEKVTPDELFAVITATTTAFWADLENHRRGRIDLYQTRRELVAQALINSGLGDKKLGFEIANDFIMEKDRLITPLPGALETLQKLKQMGVALAMITNGGSPVQRSKIERFGLAHFFDYILVEGEFGAGKPDPRVFKTCLEKLKVDPSQSWMVGDDLNRDIGGAKQLGIKGIWVDRRQKGLPVDSKIKPDRIIKTIAEL